MEIKSELLQHLSPAERRDLDELLRNRAIWSPQKGPQQLAFDSNADVIGYGGAAGGGKGLALDTPLATPSGWTTIGEVQPGDVLFDECGRTCEVLAVSDVQHRDCYRLTFDDGSSLVADDVHRWVTFTAKELAALTRKGKVRNTALISRTLLTRKGSPNHAISTPYAWGSSAFRHIVSCDKVPCVPTRCIAVDSPTRQFLAGESLIPTHNTDVIIGKALLQHKKTLILRREATQLTGIVDRISELLGTREGYNGSEKIWRLSRGRQIEFGSTPLPDDWMRYQGRPHDFLAIDEAAGFLESQVRALSGWVRSSDPTVRCQTVLAFNPPTVPEGRWVVPFFAPWLDKKHPNPAMPGELRYFAMLGGEEREVPSGDPINHMGVRIKPLSRTFIPSRVTDNAHLMKTGYMATLQALPAVLRAQMLYGDFDAGTEDDPWQVIPTAWVEEAMQRWSRPAKLAEMDSLGVDVARGGRDSTVIARRHGMWFDEPIELEGSETPNGPSVAGQVIAFLRDNAVVHIDVIGVGSSPYDFLRDLNIQSVGVNVSESARGADKSGRLRFANYRSELWWRMREALDPASNTGICLPPNRRLLADLTAVTWKLSGSTISVASRDELVKRLGKSPDHGSAYVLALIDTPKTEALLQLFSTGAEAGRKGRDYDPYKNILRH